MAVALPDECPLFGPGTALAQILFDEVEFRDGFERPGGEMLSGLQRLVEFPPHMCPAGSLPDLRVPGGVAVVSAVAIALEDTAEISQQSAEAGAGAAGMPLVEDVATGTMECP